MIAIIIYTKYINQREREREREKQNGCQKGFNVVVCTLNNILYKTHANHSKTE